MTSWSTRPVVPTAVRGPRTRRVCARRRSRCSTRSPTSWPTGRAGSWSRAGVPACGRRPCCASPRSPGWPVLADPLSNLRVPGTVAAYDPLLRVPGFADGHRPDVVLRIGGPHHQQAARAVARPVGRPGGGRSRRCVARPAARGERSHGRRSRAAPRRARRRGRRDGRRGLGAHVDRRRRSRAGRDRRR